MNSPRIICARHTLTPNSVVSNIHKPPEQLHIHFFLKLQTNKPVQVLNLFCILPVFIFPCYVYLTLLTLGFPDFCLI